MRFYYILILIILLNEVNLVSAQSFKGGFNAGFTTSQVSGDNLAGYNKAGLIGGLFVYREISKKFSLRMDFSYVMKGSRKAVHPEIGDFDFYVLKLNYIEVPFY